MFLAKKFGGILLLVLGFVITAYGFGTESNGLGILGLVLLACGVVLLILKIVRRNQSAPL